MSCNKIQFVEYPSGVPSDLFTNGALFADTSDDFGIHQTRQAEELSSDNKITTSAALPIILPDTTKNFMVLGKFINPNVHDFNFKPIKVISYSASNVITHSLLYVLSHDEKNPETAFTCELRDDESHWTVSSKKVKLKSLQYDEFEFSRANIEATWPLNEYTDGDAGVYFPLAYYGAWKEDKFVTISDMRIWFHVKHLLIKGLAKCGWIFKSPIFDLPIGKKLICYIIETKSLNQAQKERPNSFWAILTNEETFTLPETKTILFDQEDYDANDVYNPSTGIFSAQGNFGFLFDLKIKNITDAIKVRFFNEFKFRLVLQRGSQKIVIYEFTGIQYARNTRLDTSTNDFIFTLDALGINIEKGLSVSDQIFVEVDMPGLGEILYGGIFYNYNYGYLLAENEKFYPNTFIDERFRVYDLITGIAHLFRAKIHADPNSREFWLYPNYDTKWYDDMIDGYYLDETVDIRFNEQIESSEVKSQAQTTKRYQVFQFKQSTDARIIGLKYPDNNPIFSKVHDLGAYFENDRAINENPFFEPTVNDKVFSIRPPVPDPDNENYIDLPFLVDNDTGSPSYKISPRILIAHGDATYHGVNGNTIGWNWYDTTRFTVPYASQLPNLKDASDMVIKESLVYGDHKEDLFSRFWKRWVYDNLVNTKVSILGFITSNQFNSWSFRKVYHFFSNGKSVFGRLLAISDFVCDNLSVIELLPSTGNVKAPVLEERSVEDDCAGQNTILNVVRSGQTWTASSDTSLITDTIINTLIEWRYADSATWTTGTVVSNPTKPFIFRLTVELALCGKKYRTKYIVPCENKPVIIWSNVHRDPSDLTKWCITADIGGILNDAILTNTYTYSLAGDTPVAYTMGTEICGIESDPVEIDLHIIGETQFDNDCDPIPLEADYEFPPIVVNCDDNKPTVECVHVGNDMFTFVKAGNQVSPLSVYFIQYRTPGETDLDWKIWDHHSPVPIPGTVEARGVFFFCDTCPPICTAVVTCTGPMLLTNVIPEQSFNKKDAMNFEWDWSKVSDKDKKKFKSLYNNQDGKTISTMHNRLHLSDYDYCCGSDSENALKHVKYAIDNGTI